MRFSDIRGSSSCEKEKANGAAASAPKSGSGLKSRLSKNTQALPSPSLHMPESALLSKSKLPFSLCKIPISSFFSSKNGAFTSLWSKCLDGKGMYGGITLIFIPSSQDGISLLFVNNSL